MRQAIVVPQIRRRLEYKRQKQRTLRHAVQQCVYALPILSARMSDEEFEAALDELADGSENRNVLAPDVLSREHIYADHD